MEDRFTNYLSYWNEHKDKKPWYWDLIPVEKYLVSGIYCIKVAGVLVYIGKSVNVHSRICAHMYNIENNNKENKYKLLRHFHNLGYDISFDLLLTEQDGARLKSAEESFIRREAPILNSTYNHKVGSSICIDCALNYIEEHRQKV